ncbi:MAG: cobalamin transport system permease protein [Gaiellales bacterium]|jgi:iron complex transport system permease protein|nr:cobalamin transport system permease protein [Gaiellales bacterium]
MSAAVLTGRSRLRASVLLGSIALALLSALAGLLIGPVKLSAGGVVQELAHHLPFLSIGHGLGPTDALILDELRLPRVVLGLMVGGMLGLAGCAYQGVFRNPLADPYLLGSAAGAGFGATSAIALGAHGAIGPVDSLPLAAFAGSLVAVAATYVLGRSAGEGAGVLVLAGVTVGAFFTALQTFVQQHSVQNLQEIYSFILGGIATASWHDVGLVSPYFLVAVVVVLMHARVLDVLALGDMEAASLGVDVRRTRLIVVIAATIGTAAVVSVSGLIGFVGIIVPHCVRLVLKTGSMRVLLPLSLVLGAAFLVLCDLAARTLESPAELPIGIITAFLGAPFFAVVLRSARRLA